MLSLRIYIPTLNRIGEEKQWTLKEFLSKSDFKPILVCPPNEVRHHRKYYNRIMKCSKRGISCVRQWILDRSSADIVVMADDDMKFYYRPYEGSTKLEAVKNLRPMIDKCVHAVENGFIHGGVSPRQYNNAVKSDVRDNFRCHNFHFMNRTAVIEAGARFDRLQVMEDVCFTLHLLTRGYSNRIIYDYCWNQRSGSIGGCNTYRTFEVQKSAALRLQKLFPDYVRVVQKEGKSGWSISKGMRYDVTVQWKKAAINGDKI